jgi:hypothetical protein
VKFFPVCSSARLQLGFFLFGFRPFNQPKHSDHLTVNVVAELTAPANQAVHVVLHVCRRAEPRAAAQAFTMVILVGPHQFRCGTPHMITIDLIGIEDTRTAPHVDP